jgi:hypothetical protein
MKTVGQSTRNKHQFNSENLRSKEEVATSFEEE